MRLEPKIEQAVVKLAKRDDRSATYVANRLMQERLESFPYKLDDGKQEEVSRERK